MPMLETIFKNKLKLFSCATKNPTDTKNSVILRILTGNCIGDRLFTVVENDFSSTV